jgi:hypothetical protein
MPLPDSLTDSSPGGSGAPALKRARSSGATPQNIELVHIGHGKSDEELTVEEGALCACVYVVLKRFCQLLLPMRLRALRY